MRPSVPTNLTRPLGPFAVLYEQPVAVLTEEQAHKAKRAANERARKDRQKAKAKALRVNQDTSGHLSTHMTNSYRAPR